MDKMIELLEASSFALTNIYTIHELQNEFLTDDYFQELQQSILARILEEVNFAEKIGSDYANHLEAFSDYIHRLVMDFHTKATSMNIEEIAQLVYEWEPMR